jgi:hypothetical protein
LNAGFCSLANSEVSYTPSTDTKLPLIALSGEIGPDDFKQFVTFSSMARDSSETYRVYVDSPGGDVEIAMAIGRVIRGDDALVRVKEESQCLSSCIFVLAGASRRWVQGVVGIHRPFTLDDKLLTADAQKQRYEQLGLEIQAYLSEMNIPIDLYNYMLRISPHDMKLLSQDELQSYGLSENDPYMDAANMARTAKSLGISMDEYLRRRAKAKDECYSGQIDDTYACYSRIMGTGN